ncbi:hypothetical protein Lser_V15G33475 [Lactuca serriola]
MATAGDGRATYESRGDSEKSRKAFRPEGYFHEEPHNVSQEAGQIIKNLTGLSEEGGNCAITLISELEQIKELLGWSEIQHPTIMENLSDDLLSNIFIRLLAKELAKMRCVSKSWNAFLSQPSLIKSHLKSSINNNNRVLLVFYKKTYFDPKPFTAHPCQAPHHIPTDFIKFPPVNPKAEHTTSMIKVIGSVHGLICSCYSDDVIHIWNPSLSAVSTLPPYSTPSCSGNTIYFRFGYDPKTKDYKVVKLQGLIGPPSRLCTISYVVKEMLQVEVYSMRKGSWKLTTQRFPSHVTKIFEPDYLCVDGHDGHLHWLGYCDQGNVYTIVAFDLGLETFREIPLPDSLSSDNNRSKLLGVWAGKICVMLWVKGGRSIDVWVMDEYGVAESWVKRNNVSSQCISSFFFGYTSHNEICIVNDSGHFLLYNPAAHEDNVLKESFNEEYNVSKIVEYVDSLAWVASAIQ